MTQLTSIIKKVDSKAKPSNSWEKRIVLGINGEILEKEPSFFSRNSAEYYIVSNSSNELFADHTTSSFKIEVFGKGKFIDIKILSKVGCMEGKEHIFAQNLGYKSEHSAELTLNNYIRDWINSFVANNQNDFIDNFYQNQYGNKLLDYIKGKAKETGIIFQDILYYLEGQEYLKTISVKNDKIETRFKDSTKNYTFALDATLLVNEEKKINVISTHKRPADLEKIIYEQIKEYFPKNVDSEPFASNRLSVENQIRVFLNLLLEQYGREIGAIKLTSGDIPEVPEIIEKDFAVSVNTPEYPEPIRVNNKILIKRVDIAKYIDNQPENLDEWLKKQVEETIASSFFGFKYSEINERFENFKLNIKENLKSIVHKIGYELEQIIVIPSFKGLEPLEKIDFYIDSAFITKDQEEVTLKTEIHVAVNDLKKISQYIDNDRIKSVESDLKELCFKEIKKFIAIVTVDNFHKNFEFTKLQIVKQISEIILEQFGATITYIFFDRGEEDVVRKMAELKKVGWTKFESEIHSVIDYGRITFGGEFRVESGDLELWQIFRNQDIKIDNLKAAIENSLKSNLKTKSSKGYLGYKTDEDRDKIHKVIETTAIETIKTNYGINIKVSNIDRNEQDWETSGTKMRERILEEITSLNQGLLEATAAGLYDEAKDIKKRLNNLNREIKNLDAPQNRKQLGK